MKKCFEMDFSKKRDDGLSCCYLSFEIFLDGIEIALSGSTVIFTPPTKN